MTWPNFKRHFNAAFANLIENGELKENAYVNSVGQQVKLFEETNEALVLLAQAA